MNQLLKLNQTVQLDNGSNCTVKSFLGSGGQGEVYEADLNGVAVALKWYFPQQAKPEQHAALQHLLKIGAPNANFLWPLALASSIDDTNFGYVMPLRPSNYKNISDLVKRRIELSFRQLLTATVELTDSMLQLHAKGLCYRDISFGNFFIDPDKGAILICDNDNVTINGSKISGTAGTPRFMAPEIVRSESNPNSDSDLFSLSVLLFYLLFLHHPLEGKREATIKCFDLPAMNKLYGFNPLFIFDPNDNSNYPVKGYQENALIYWDIYPQFIKDLFMQSFTNGLNDLHSRVRGSEWRQKLLALKDNVIDCVCGAENFYDQAHVEMAEELPLCWSCNQRLILPPRIRIKHSTQEMTIVLNQGAELYPYHIYSARKNELSPAVAKVVQHPQNPNVWGLKNLSTDTWTFTEKGTVKTVAQGQSVTLVSGINLNFGQTQAEVLK
ncbi:protein kinase [Methylomonas sp. AM2-LC]|uniref:protein kinase domain-containing protein n=1 Tax=Methylomonas sp. AM2-LC TaxID=3153301 RepID=UPI00326551AD